MIGKKMKKTKPDVIITTPRLFELYNHMRVINWLKYKGKGRPKNTDYVFIKDWRKEYDKP